MTWNATGRVRWVLVVAAAFAGCGNKSEAMRSAHGDIHQFVVDRLLYPGGAAEFAADVDGDGHPDNQLGLVMHLINDLNLSPQAALNKSFDTGATVLAAALQTADPMLATDDMVGLTLRRGVPLPGMARADFSGGGAVTLDESATPTTVFGTLLRGRFDSDNPVSTGHSRRLVLSLAFIAGQDSVSAEIDGTQIRCEPKLDRGDGVTGIVNGEIHGALNFDFVRGPFLSQLATIVTAEIRKNPQAPFSMSALELLDIGCPMGDGPAARRNDRIIDACEIYDNPVFGQLLQPDVQLYDKDGFYAPVPGGDMKNALSIGIGFTAVSAHF